MANAHITQSLVEVAVRQNVDGHVTSQLVEVAVPADPPAVVTSFLMEVAASEQPICPVTRVAGHDWNVRGVGIRWIVDGTVLSLNAKEVKITDSPRYSAPATFSGEVVLSQDREDNEQMVDGTTRPGRLRDKPKQIEVTFPRLPVHFWFRMRQLRTFARRFQVELLLYDGIDRDRLVSDDGKYWYGACGAWKPNTVTVYRNRELVTGGIQIQHQLGIIRFQPGIEVGDLVEVTYTWAPNVIIVDQLKANFVPGIRKAQAEVSATLQEMRPTSNADSWTTPGGGGGGGGTLGTRRTLGARATVLGPVLRTLGGVARSGSSGIGPGDVPGVWHWLKADGITGLLDNAPVTNWPDFGTAPGGPYPGLVGLGGYGSRPPVFRTNQANGLPMVEYRVSGGIGAYLGVDPDVAMFTGTSLWTHYFVLKRLDSTQASMMSWGSQGPVGETPNREILLNDFVDAAVSSENFGYVLRQPHHRPVGQLYIWTIQRYNIGSLPVGWRQYINGVEIESVTSFDGWGNPTTPYFFGALFRGTFLSHYFRGMLAESIHWQRTLSTPEHGQIITYLKDKWEIP